MRQLIKSILFLSTFPHHGLSRDYSNTAIKSKVDKLSGGKSKGSFKVTYLTGGNSVCTGCSLCDGSKNTDLFDPKSGNDFCVRCDRSDNYDCHKIMIETKFDRAWIMRYFTLTSSSGSTAEDPGLVQMYASWNNCVHYHHLLHTSSHFETSERKKDFQQLFRGQGHNTAYNCMRLYIYKKHGTHNLRLGGYGIRQDYLSHYLHDLNQDLLGVATFQISKIRPYRYTRIGTIHSPRSQFIISFNVYLHSGLTGHDGVLRFTQNYNSCCNYGDRNPAFITNHGNMHSVCGSNRNGNHYVNVVGFNTGQDNTVRMVAVGDYVRVYVNGVERGYMSQHYTWRPIYRPLSVWATDTFNGPAHYLTLSKIVYRAID